MTGAITSRIAEIAELAPQLAEREKQLRSRQSIVDQRCHSAQFHGGPIPPELAEEKRLVQVQMKELAAQRKQLLAEVAELRASSGLSERLARMKSRNSARKHGMELSREEYDSALAALRVEQGMFDRVRNWLDGTTPRAKDMGAAISAVWASSHDPLSFDHNDW